MPTDTELKQLDLEVPERSAIVRFAGKEATHYFRPLTLADWLAYFTRLSTEFITSGEEMTSESDQGEASEALWNSAVLRVEGYTGADWRERMPVSHKVAAVTALQQVLAIDAGNPFDLEPDSRTVHLEAAWNGAIFDELLHRFRLPNAQDQKDYRRLNVSFIRSRGRRDQNTTRIKACVRIGELCRLWDALSIGIEGYQGGKFSMDPLHKMAAVAALFEPPESE